MKTVVLSGVGKGALDVSGRDQEGERKRFADDVSKRARVASKPGHYDVFRERVWRVPDLLARRCPAWRRREPDQAAFAWNVRRRVPMLLLFYRGGERERSGWLRSSGIEYRCGVRRRTGS